MDLKLITAKLASSKLSSSVFFELLYMFVRFDIWNIHNLHCHISHSQFVFYLCSARSKDE